MSTRSTRRASVFAVATLAFCATAVSAAITHAAQSDPVLVFYTQCDETSTTATVKVKRINADGTNPITIGDTGVAHCGSNMDIPDIFHSGFAVSGEYGYFAWQKSDESQSGIGRIRLDGTAAAELNFITISSEVKQMQMSPRAVDGMLYFYADSGERIPANFFSGRKNPRIMRANTSTKDVSVVYQPEPADPSGYVSYMSFGVGTDALYYSTDDSMSKDLEKVSFAGVRSGVHLSLATSDNAVNFLNGRGANLIAESSDTLFLYTNVQADGTYGISTVGSASPTSSFARFAAVPAVDPNDMPTFQVWGGDHLYYKNGTGKQISRTSKAGAVENNVFPSIVTEGWVHHISPARASTVTVTTTTSTTTSTTSSTTSTTAVSPTTSADLRKLTVPKKGGLAGSAVARYLAMKVPKGAKVGLKVAPQSSKVCAVRRSKLVALKSGNCKVTTTVTPKKGRSTRKSTTIRIP